MTMLNRLFPTPPCPQAQVRLELRETREALDAKTTLVHQLTRELERAETNLSVAGRSAVAGMVFAQLAGTTPTPTATTTGGTDLSGVQREVQRARARYDECMADVLRLGRRVEALQAELAAIVKRGAAATATVA